ncbi:MAG: hypothetical protein EA404_08075 [Spirochaetaceae bacterium]|nr:MAG: hypothetical protein EA404_08075 [Spirochaetaceae bacterium]
MKVRIGFSVGCALFALIVSLFSGIVTGVPFATVVIRALVFAVVFAGLGSAAQVAVSRFLPELEQVLDGSNVDAQESDAAGEARPAVDIVVDDSDDVDGVGSAQVADMADESGSEDVGDDGLLEVGDEGGGYDAELEPDREPDGDAEPVDDLVAEAEEVEADQDREFPAAAPDPADGIDASGVDQLPDVGGYSDAFEGSEGIASGGESESNRSSSDQDPALMARALQTILKRDE